jgi:hypothetical protein
MFDLSCLIGLVVDGLVGLIVGVPIGMRLYWKTGHW